MLINPRLNLSALLVIPQISHDDFRGINDKQSNELKRKLDDTIIEEWTKELNKAPYGFSVRTRYNPNNCSSKKYVELEIPRLATVECFFNDFKRELIDLLKYQEEMSKRGITLYKKAQEDFKQKKSKIKIEF